MSDDEETREDEDSAVPDVTDLELEGERLVVISFPIEELPDIEDVTPAEREVVTGMLEGKSNLEIARDRGTSERTVANQVASIFRKLGVASRSELAARLLQD